MQHRFVATELPGVILIEPPVHRDRRGFFLEAWHRDKYAAAGIEPAIVQLNHSRSAGGTVRGLHAQLDPPQGKLVRALEGAILDVAVDIRRGSPTFARWVGVELRAEEFRELWVPPGFAHGFAVLSEAAQVEYGCTAPYRPEGEIAIAWDDPQIGIRWPVASPVLSDRDAAAPRLQDLLDRLPEG